MSRLALMPPFRLAGSRRIRFRLMCLRIAGLCAARRVRARAANQSGNSIYAAAPQVTHSITVDKASLTLTAKNLSFVYGQSVPALTYSSAGFVNGDTAARAYTGSPKLATTATSASKPGAYPIVISAGTLKSVNYRFALKNGTMTVKPAGTIAMPAAPTKAGTGPHR